MYISAKYQGEQRKIYIELPLSFSGLTAAVENAYGLKKEEQQLIVRNVQVTEDSDINKLQLHRNTLNVFKVNSLIVNIGSVSFPCQFCLSFTCTVFCNYVLDIMRSSGFSVPNFEYCLEIDHKLVDMTQCMKDVGCTEQSDIIVVSKTGESLSPYFEPPSNEDLPAEQPEEQKEEDNVSIEQPENQEDNLPAEQPEKQADDLPAEQPQAQVEQQSVQDDIPLPKSRSSATYSSKESQRKTDEYVTMTRHKVASHEPTESQPVKRTTIDQYTTEMQSQQDLPKLVQEVLSQLSQTMKGNEGLKQYQDIESLFHQYQNQINDVLKENQLIQENIDTIHYENQMLREMYNQAVPSEETRQQAECAAACSFARPVNSYNADELDLPDNIEALKKLVDEKYATALMNERRYIKEKKRCQKYQLVARTLGVNEENVNDYYSQIHEVTQQRDQLKEENLDLKEEIRSTNATVDSRDDEIRRLTTTVQCRDDTIKTLVEKIEQLENTKGIHEEKHEYEEKQEEEHEPEHEQEESEKKQEEELMRREQLLIEREEELKKREEENIQREGELNQRENELFIKENEFQSQLSEMQVTPTNEEVNEANLMKINEVTLKEEALATKEEELTTKKTELATKEEELTIKEEELIAKEEELAIREELLVKEEVNKDDMKDESTVKIEELQNTLAEKEKYVMSLEEELQKQEETINSLKEKQSIIQEVKSEMDEARTVIQEQTVLLDEKDNLIENLKSQLDSHSEINNEDVKQLQEENTNLKKELETLREEDERNVENEDQLVSKLAEAMELITASLTNKKNRIQSLGKHLSTDN